MLLEPLSLEHAEELIAIARDDDIWRYLVFDTPATLEDMQRFIGIALDLQQRGSALPFIMRDPTTREAIGSTRYMDIVPADRVLEIGWTWFARPYWRTGANVESKYLLLKYAFEEAAAIRVQIKTDLRNTRSQAAIEGLGAVREGILRNHRVVKGGHRRSSVVYSILEEEWPAVKANLESRLGA